MWVETLHHFDRSVTVAALICLFTFWRKPYSGILTRLPRKGYITFAPQHLYVLGDMQLQTQRRAYPLKKTVFALMISMHRQIVRFLATQPNVDMDRLAFYGLSYGGKSAMHIPPLIDEYQLAGGAIPFCGVAGACDFR